MSQIIARAASSATAATSRVIKTPDFQGRLAPRSLYVYLPPGYDEQPDRHYPVLFMHDGQNCFECYVEDSYAGSWRADETADHLINQGLMRPCIIVGVSHGGSERIVEYMPPYATHQPRVGNYPIPWPKASKGRADETFTYYRDDVAPYIRQKYRILEGRDHLATCGSSMGGLFSTYIAWEHPDFARHHAVLSPSFRVTSNWRGHMETVVRLRKGEPRPLRLWLDSGTRDGHGSGDDGAKNTQTARDALLANGYELGTDFQYFLDEGAVHSESAWAARLDRILPFYFLLIKQRSTQRKSLVSWSEEQWDLPNREGSRMAGRLGAKPGFGDKIA